MLFNRSVTSTLCDPMDCHLPGFPVLHYLSELAQTHVHRVGDALCHPLLLLPSVFPRIRVFSSESALHIRYPKYWISLSNEYSGLSFRIEWFHLLAVQVVHYREKKSNFCFFPILSNILGNMFMLFGQGT